MVIMRVTTKHDGTEERVPAGVIGEMMRGQQGTSGRDVAATCCERLLKINKHLILNYGDYFRRELLPFIKLQQQNMRGIK